MPEPLDTPEAYAQEVRKRTIKLSSKASRLHRQQLGYDRKIRRSKETLHDMMSDLADDLVDLEDEMHDVAKQIKKLIVHFQRLAMKEQLKRVEDKADVWHPERYITRDELMRMKERMKE